MQQQRGAIAINVLLAIMVVIIGVLIYLLAGSGKSKIGNVGGIESMPITNSANTNTPDNHRPQSGDGLGTPDSATQYPLDEFGEGTSRIEVFMHDINDDGRPDRITKSRVENGTPHFYDEYKIELNTDNGYIDITPDDFRTIEGADCALQRFQFIFQPTFQVIKVSRPWHVSWDTPTMATKTRYGLQSGKLRQISSENLKVICNVADIF